MISTRMEEHVGNEFKIYCAINGISQQECVHNFILECIKKNEDYIQSDKRPRKSAQ